VKSSLIIFLFIWVRTSFPRLRYDQLMSLLWKTYLPLSLSFIIIINSCLWLFNALPPLQWF
jgi:NADH-ubiquinone oxidoreductase chain 1